MSKPNKEKPKKDPFQGSIKACRDSVFEEKYAPSRVKWSWNHNGEEIAGELNPACLTIQLKKLFKELEVDYEIETHDSIALKSAIPGLPVELSYDGTHHVRLRFSGRTESEFDSNRDIIQSYLKEKDINYENYCLFVCVTGGRQAELTTKYLSDMEKAE